MSPVYERGDTVEVELYAAGSGVEPPVGSVVAIVLHAGSECDVLLHPAEDLHGEAGHLLGLCGLSLDDVREGPVFVLRNCQPEHMALLHRFDASDYAAGY